MILWTDISWTTEVISTKKLALIFPVVESWAGQDMKVMGSEVKVTGDIFQKEFSLVDLGVLVVVM